MNKDINTKMDLSKLNCIKNTAIYVSVLLYEFNCTVIGIN